MRAGLLSVNSYCPKVVVALVSTADSMCSVPCFPQFQVEDVMSYTYLNYFFLVITSAADTDGKTPLRV